MARYPGKEEHRFVLINTYESEIMWNANLMQQHKLIGFYNRDEKCLQSGADWVFK